MSGYQVTGWLAWQHHMALVMMAGFYILSLKLEQQDQIPLLSVRDARLLVIVINFATQKSVFLVRISKDTSLTKQHCNAGLLLFYGYFLFYQYPVR